MEFVRCGRKRPWPDAEVWKKATTPKVSRSIWLVQWSQKRTDQKLDLARFLRLALWADFEKLPLQGWNRLIFCNFGTLRLIIMCYGRNRTFLCFFWSGASQRIEGKVAFNSDGQNFHFRVMLRLGLAAGHTSSEDDKVRGNKRAGLPTSKLAWKKKEVNAWMPGLGNRLINAARSLNNKSWLGCARKPYSGIVRVVRKPHQASLYLGSWDIFLWSHQKPGKIHFGKGNSRQN
jgi:hypothetical protein